MRTLLSGSGAPAAPAGSGTAGSRSRRKSSPLLTSLSPVPSGGEGMGEGEVHRGARGRVPRFAFHGSGEDPRRSDSARLPSVTLALAAPGPPVQLRWTTLRVQGPTLRDAALANGGNGSPPVARGPPPLPPDAPGRQLAQLLARGGQDGWSAYWFLGYPFG